MRRATIRAWLACLCTTVCLHTGAALAVSAEEFGAMDPEQALKLPAIEALSVFGWKAGEFRFVLENSLIDLRYLYQPPSGQSSSALTAAVKAFQRDIGARETGVILVGQFMDLVQRTNEFWQAPVIPGPAFIIDKGDLVTAEGTWHSEQVRESDPIQSTGIRCYRTANLCSMVTAKLVMSGDEAGWFHSSVSDLALHAQDWIVREWSDKRIVAEDRSARCLEYTLTMDLAAEQVSMQRAVVAGGSCAEAAATATYRLIGGYEVASPYWEARQARLLSLRSAKFQAVVKRLQAGRHAPAQ